LTINDELTKLLKIFPNFCYRINATAASVWRREQKRAMLGIGMKIATTANIDDMDRLAQATFATIGRNTVTIGQRNNDIMQDGNGQGKSCNHCRPAKTLAVARKQLVSVRLQ
jgi:hypothetical protein